MTDMLEGGCACGRLRYRMRSAPMFVHCCHCKDCQRQTGTAFVLNALIEADRVERAFRRSDALSDADRQWPAASRVPLPRLRHRGLERIRRPDASCVSSVSAHSTIRTALPPDVHIYTRSKLPWIALPEGVPTFEAYYNSRELWPAASLERRKARRVGLAGFRRRATAHRLLRLGLPASAAPFGRGCALVRLHRRPARPRPCPDRTSPTDRRHPAPCRRQDPSSSSAAPDRYRPPDRSRRPRAAGTATPAAHRAARRRHTAPPPRACTSTHSPDNCTRTGSPRAAETARCPAGRSAPSRPWRSRPCSSSTSESIPPAQSVQIDFHCAFADRRRC